MITSNITDAIYSALRKSDDSKRLTFVDVGNGRSVAVSCEVDEDTNLNDFDYYGKLYHTRSDTRPPECDGHARKMNKDRFTTTWWQPPADAKNNQDLFDILEEQVRGWVHDDWHYQTYGLHIRKSPCECCGAPRNEGSEYISGIESSTAEDDLVAMLADMYWPLKEDGK